MTKIHNFERDLKRVVERIEKSKIQTENKSKIFEFKDYLLSEGIGYARITKYLQQLIKVDERLNKKFVEANEQDIRKVVSKINQSNYSESTKRDYRLVLRKFYRFLRGCKKKGIYPPEVEWISLTMANNHKKLPEELLTESEIKSIIKHCETIRDKALVATLAETGARVSEVGNLKLKHVSMEEYGARLNLSGKTGTRKVLVVSCAPLLHEWINQHPKNENPEAYLWYNPKGELLQYARIKTILKKAARRAGIKKRVHPHLLRHSQATHMASMMSESSMKQYFGWTQGSKMAGIYVHMSGKETDETILRANGIEIKKDLQESKLKPQNCERCKTLNSATNKFCRSCGFPLNKQAQEEVMQKENQTNKINDVMNFLVKDPKILEMITQRIKEAEV
ncbi:MAG: tyrosine-type recombinase/integrase [Nanoarchaeota archaeon]|nr:tyrosine-type recombinase/integrase [Nanoarchaeota archaeon]MBU1051102.1 tyrosine-type recombinase/integrase [Nanoarchaeota archaeon]MBU1987958.1 tyrosine-type recombinase/integrase [Nanoarchaeota archaeon]